MSSRTSVRMSCAAWVLPVVLAMGGCSTTKGKALYYREGFQAPDLVAILPPESHAVSMAAPDTFRRVTATALVALGYLPMVSPAQEATLQRMGLTDGGQLRAFKAKDIAARLKVDGLVYGEVEEFKDVNIGVYRNRKVKGQLSLVSSGGEMAWKVSGHASNKKVTSAIAQSLVEGLATSLVEKILKIHLLEEASLAAFMMQQKIPEWPEPSPAKLRAIRRDKPRGPERKNKAHVGALPYASR